MKKLILFIICAGLIIWASTTLVYAQDQDLLLDFAHSLFNENDFNRAVTEAKRFVFQYPKSPRLDEAHLLIGRSYSSLRQFAEAKNHYREVIGRGINKGLVESAIWELGRSIEATEKRQIVLSFYKNLTKTAVLPGQAGEKIQNDARIRLGWLLMEDGRWEDAQEYLNAVDQTHESKRLASNLSEQSINGRNLKYYNPTMAGALSTFLPGAGQIYNGRNMDAALAFGFNAVFLYAAFESYSKESWVVFGVFSMVEIGWYTGNIYNAVNGAHKNNKKIRNNFLQKIKKQSSIGFGFAPKSKSLFASWKIAF